MTEHDVTNISGTPCCIYSSSEATMSNMGKCNIWPPPPPQKKKKKKKKTWWINHGKPNTIRLRAIILWYVKLLCLQIKICSPSEPRDRFISEYLNNMVQIMVLVSEIWEIEAPWGNIKRKQSGAFLRYDIIRLLLLWTSRTRNMA